MDPAGGLFLASFAASLCQVALAKKIFVFLRSENEVEVGIKLQLHE